MKSMKKILCFGMMLFFLLTTVLPCNAEAYPETVQDSLTEDKGNFTSYGGSWEYTEDGYTQTDSMISGTSYHYGSYFQYSYEDFTVSFRMKLNKVGDSEGYAGMLFRKAKPDDTTEASGYMMAVKGYGSIYFQNWSETKTIFQLPLDTPYEWHTYKFEVEGTKIKFYLDGKLCQSIHDSDFSSGYFSFTTGTSSATFADFEISGTPIGNAESIGQINDGNLDKAAADVIFEERAAIDETEQAEEPS